MKVTIDRFEDGYAVLLVRGEEDVHIDFPERLLPEGCREGDILEIGISRDTESTEATRKRVSDLIEKLKKKNVGRAPDDRPD
jgi:hypothetical protein